MDSTIPVGEPAIILSDNPDIVTLFNEAQFPEEGGDILTPSIASVLSRISSNQKKDSLFLTNKNAGFIKMEYQAMLNGSPKLTLELLEFSEFFETKLLRSATTNLLEQAKQDNFQGDIVAPTTQFYIAFGLGDDLRYWSSMHSYQLIGAETYSDFDQAKIIELSFVSNTGLQEFSHKSLQQFINPSLLDSGQIAVAEVLHTEGDEDPTPAKNLNRLNKYVKARRSFRKKNFPFYVAGLDNLTDKFLQVLFNTTNVFILNYSPPYEFIEAEIKKNKPVINVEETYKKVLEKANSKPDRFASYDERWQLQSLKLILEKFYSTFNENLVQVEVKSASYENNVTIQQVSDRKQALNAYKAIKNLGIQLNSTKEKGKDKVEIKSMLDSLLTAYGEVFKSNDYVMMRENDLKILDVLDKAVQADFGESQFDPRRPLIILGPKELISNYVFGQEYDIKKKTSIFSKTPNPVKKHIDLRTKRIFNLYNSQNINKTTLAKLLADKQASLNNIIQERNLPVFRYNTQNANVMSMTVNDNRAYLSLLTQSYALLADYASTKTVINRDPTAFIDEFIQAAMSDASDLINIEKAIKDPRASRPPSTKVLQVLEEEKQKKRDLIKKLADEKASAFAGYLAKASKEERAEVLIKLAKDSNAAPLLRKVINKTFNEGSDSADADVITKILKDSNISDEQKFDFINSDQGLSEDLLALEAKAFENTVKEKHGLVTVVEGIYSNDPVKFFTDQMAVIDQAIFQVEIETLPYFPISTLAYMQIPCILFATRPQLVGVNKGVNPLDSVTGAYNILGFYHRIDTNKASSKFKLFSIPSLKEE